MPEPIVVCPKCGHRFAVTKALTAEIEASLRSQYEAETKEREKAAKLAFEKRLDAERAKLAKEAAARAAKASAAELKELRTSLASAERKAKAARAEFARQLAAEKLRLEREALRQAKESVSAEISELRKQMKQRDVKLKQMRERETEMQRREGLVRAREQKLQKEIERQVEAARKKTLQDVTESLEKEYRSRELRHGKVVADLRKQLGEARQKLEQYSQQAQGEVIERELERVLSAAFPGDDIKPIAKGKLGVDILHKVYSPSGQHCGTIVWESKNTKSWSNSWLPKLKTDQRREKAEIAVLVSSALPKNLESRFGQIEGVWVAEFSVVPGLAAALRGNLVELARVRAAGAAVPQKMEVLYHYLMSIEFRQRVEAIVEAFISMKTDLDKEKRATEKNWAKREKHLQVVVQNVSGMVGDIQAVAPAFPKIRRLELPPPR